LIKKEERLIQDFIPSGVIPELPLNCEFSSKLRKILSFSEEYLYEHILPPLKVRPPLRHNPDLKEESHGPGRTN
jgi:hypothetical protein